MRDRVQTVCSRRDVLVLVGGSVLSATMVTARPSPARGQDTKVSRDQARYQDTPNDGQRCSGCALFVAPRGCTVVAGDISPDGWCALFVPKPA